MSKLIANLAPPEMWEDDPKKVGWILVDRKGEIRWARPHFQFGQFRVPTLEWVTKYYKKVGVWVETLEDTEYLIWTGFFPLEESALEFFDESFPYREVSLGVDFRSYIETSEDGQEIYIVHTDGTKIRVKRKESENEISVIDGVLDNEIKMDKDGISFTDTHGNTFVMANDGVKINGHYLVTHEYLDWLNQNSPNIGLGNLGAPVMIFPSALASLTPSLNLPDQMKTDKIIT